MQTPLVPFVVQLERLVPSPRSPDGTRWGLYPWLSPAPHSCPYCGGRWQDRGAFSQHRCADVRGKRRS